MMQPWVRFRLGIIYTLFLGFLGLVIFRLLQLQVFADPELKSLAQRQYERVGRVSRYRLPLLDRNGEELAASIPAPSAFARPRLIRHKRETARKLAKILNGSPGRWLIKIDSPRPFVWLERQLTPEKAAKLAAAKIPGVFIEPESKRTYPAGPLAGSLLGFTDIDGTGISGLELTLNEKLLEPSRQFTLIPDGRGTPTYVGRQKRGPSDKDKNGVYLTLDRRLQTEVEEALEDALVQTGAQAAFAVVLDPRTGEVFAMGQRPSFDPGHASRAKPALWTNRMVSYLYEPGSTMKVLLAASALDDGLLNRNSPIDCKGGRITVADRTITEAEASERFGVIPLEEVIRVSSNVGAVQIAHQMGAERVRKTLEKFGLTKKTGIALIGEASSGPRPDDFWTPVHLATAGFGQGISTTPLQMTLSYAPFANGGYAVRPKLLKSELLSTEDRKPVISSQTAQTMKEILVSVTEEKGGTGRLAKVEGIRVAGKTGTAQKYEMGKGYDSGKYFSSFIGFLPADRPELLIGVMIDEPRHDYYGGKVAAPLFKRIAEHSLRLLDKAPKTPLARDLATKTPDPEQPSLTLTLKEGDDTWPMPDLSGRSLREVFETLGAHTDRITVSGSGYVQHQSPPTGTLMGRKSRITISLNPPS